MICHKQFHRKERLSALGGITSNFKSWSVINIQDLSVVYGRNLVPVEDKSSHTKIGQAGQDGSYTSVFQNTCRCSTQGILFIIMVKFLLLWKLLCLKGNSILPL